MKRGLNIQINFTNKFLYTFVAFIFILIIGIGVYAFGTSTPSTFGHSGSELDLSSGVSGNVIFNDNVGIGTSNPQVKLDVNGEVRIGNTGIACTSNIESSQRYNSVNKIMEYCDGTSWQSYGTAPPPFTGLTLISGKTEQDCLNEGGIVEGNEIDGYFCRITSSSCPSGWQKHEFWSAHPVRTCSSLFAACSGPSSCSTDSKVWSNIPPRSASCTYFGLPLLWSPCEDQRSRTCFAILSEIGCI